VANPGYWHIEGTIHLAAGGALLDLASGEKTADAGENALRVTLRPFGLVAYRTQSGSLSVKSYETKKISEAELSHMRGIAERVQTLMADREIRLVLAPEDRAFVQTTIEQARSALNNRQYARAWSLLKHHRFWSCWKDYLEKATERLRRAGTVPNGDC
jgi:hypothetical protein